MPSDVSRIRPDDYVIAADSGLYHCNSADIVPNLLVGDFDSYSGELPENSEIIVLPTHKDDTDLLFAVRCGKERGFTEFLLIGGYGSRPDQNFAMIQTLIWLSENIVGVKATALCGKFYISVLKNGSLTLEPDDTRYLSVFAVGGSAYGVEIVGAEYTLSDAVLTESFPIGVSNVAADVTTISVKNGTLLIMSVEKDI